MPTGGWQKVASCQSGSGSVAGAPLVERYDLAQEAAQVEEVAEVCAVLVAGGPGLAPLRRVDLWVVPGEDPRRRQRTATCAAAWSGRV